MDTLFLELVKTSPVLAVMVVFWWYTRKDFTSFVNKVQEENLKREEKYQETIKDLTYNIQTDIKEIKNIVTKKEG